MENILNICRLNASVLYPLTVIYIMMGITGTLGNMMVCIVIARCVFVLHH